MKYKLNKDRIISITEAKYYKPCDEEKEEIMKRFWVSYQYEWYVASHSDVNRHDIEKVIEKYEDKRVEYTKSTIKMDNETITIWEHDEYEIF